MGLQESSCACEEVGVNWKARSLSVVGVLLELLRFDISGDCFESWTIPWQLEEQSLICEILLRYRGTWTSIPDWEVTVHFPHKQSSRRGNGETPEPYRKRHFRTSSDNNRTEAHFRQRISVSALLLLDHPDTFGVVEMESSLGCVNLLCAPLEGWTVEQMPHNHGCQLCFVSGSLNSLDRVGLRSESVRIRLPGVHLEWLVRNETRPKVSLPFLESLGHL